MTSTYRIAPEIFFIDRRDRRTLQMQLATSIVSTILDTRALPGTRMPSTRKLSETLNISRLTVTLVYQDLVAQGYLEPLPRSGFVISRKVPHRRVQADTAASGVIPAVDWTGRLAHRLDQRRKISKPRDWRSYPYPFIYGQVDPTLFDHNAWRDCARRALGQRDFPELADDRLAQDDPVLVDYVRRNTLPRRGINASPDEVLITLGAQNALWIAATLLATPDRLGVMEDPGFPDFAETLRFLGMPRHFVQGDEGGLDPDLLPPDTGLVFVTPSHNIPAGATMPRERRRHLLDLADQKDFLIIEDDYETEMSFLEPPSPSLKAMDRAGRVIYVGSFSKSLFPGLRIGYLVAPPEFIRQARELRTMMLRHAPGHMQRVTGYFLALGHYDAHVVRLREIFRRRREALVTALGPTDIHVVGAARHGGSSLWVAGPEHIDSRDLATHLAPRGVLIEPGHPFFSNPAEVCNLFRLGYSSIAEAQIGKGVQIMQETVAALATSSGRVD
nr:PLP-dependent aminotransferase family protein [Defluviimonas sp.]